MIISYIATTILWLLLFYLVSFNVDYKVEIILYVGTSYLIIVSNNDQNKNNGSGIIGPHSCPIQHL